MSEWTVIRHARSGETIHAMTHRTGLPVYVWPKPGYRSAHALFATNYGSIDTAFRTGGVRTEVPAGIAHYLEHKLFESEDGDAFARFAKTGASANAYTSFDRTAYLFSCSGRLEESLDILLDFVQAPYFTQEGVDKERGIIEQEIRMGLDSPNRRVFMNLLDALYAEHPVRLDIAGSVESIAAITPELLYGCYSAFYNLNNMVLAVAGDVSCELVEAACDRLLKPAADGRVERAPADEPRAARRARVEQRMPVSAPLFYLGFKQAVSGMDFRPPAETAAAQALCEILAGQASPLYARLMDAGLINASFEAEYFDGPGFACWLFGGESRDPDAVCAAVREEIARLRAAGVPPADFRAARAALYGRQISQLNTVNGCAGLLVRDHFAGRAPLTALDAAAALDIGDVNRLLAGELVEEQSALSVILPA